MHNPNPLIEAVQSLLNGESGEGCSDDLSVVNRSDIDALRQMLNEHYRYAKHDEKGPFEDHRSEGHEIGSGSMWVVRWSCDFETRIYLDFGATEEDAREVASEIDVPEGTAVYISDTFEISDIDPEE